MRTIRGLHVSLIGVLLTLALGAGSAAAVDEGGKERISVAQAEVRTPGPMTVVAHIDSGVNPYNKNFKDRSRLAFKHPSTYIPGYPKDAKALRLTLNAPYDKALARDEDVWSSVARGQLYWIPGTKIIGAISFGAGGTNCPSVTSVPPVGGFIQGSCKEHTILDDHGHGTMTASRSAGKVTSLAKGARLVSIEGLGAGSVQWAAEQGWIDVQTNSWLSLVPPPIPSDVTDAFAYAADRMMTLAASGNGTAYITGIAPTPTYLLSTAPPGVVLVGGHDNGKSTLWAGAPPHVVADAYAGPTALVNSSVKIKADPISCCTSAASPYAAGGAAALIEEARRIVGDRTTGTHGKIYACGSPNMVKKGPLKDGLLTLAELKDIFFHSAEPFPAQGRHDGKIHWAGDPRAPDNVEYGPGGNPFCVGCTTTPVPWSSLPDEADGSAYTFVGYGGINERSIALGKKILRGKADVPERPAADAQYELDQQVRTAFFATAEEGKVDGGCVSVAP
jgi:hypothetical protein